jgi:phosphoribosylformylglycinamidine synthase
VKVGVVVFPGSNCDVDALHVARSVGATAVPLWHKERDLQGCDAIVVPGGFSYGDYLRCGAIARFSPVMDEVARHAARGGKVLGICNGFQVLTEAGLLPGVLRRNQSLKFICAPVELTVERADTAFTRRYRKGQVVRMHIAHAEGNYVLDDEGLKALEGNGQVVLRYVQNPNGSRNAIAGIINAQGNVLGMMPHPERAAEALLGGNDGAALFESFLQA